MSKEYTKEELVEARIRRNKTTNKLMKLEWDKKRNMPIAVETDHVEWTDTPTPFIKAYVKEHQQIPSYWHEDLDKYREEIGNDLTKAMVKAIGHEPGSVYPWEQNKDKRHREAVKEVMSPNFAEVKAKWKKKYNEWYSKWKQESQKPTNIIRKCPYCGRLVVNTVDSYRKCKERRCECNKLTRSEDTKNGESKVLGVKCKVPCPRCRDGIPTTLPINLKAIKELQIHCPRCHISFHVLLSKVIRMGEKWE